MSYRLLNVGSNAKTIKGDKQGVYRTGILYLAPSDSAGVGNFCPKATPGCRAGCLYFAGRGRFSQTQLARINKSKRFVEDRRGFLADLTADIQRIVRSCKKAGIKPAFRLNGTSDLLWERIPVVVNGTEYENYMAAFPEAIFYDYTKIPLRTNIPSNYRITFSVAENNEQDALLAFKMGFNLAVVFNKTAKNQYPSTFWGIPVIDGDRDDLRFLDPPGSVVALKAKGTAIKDTSGFVRDIKTEWTRPTLPATWGSSFGQWAALLG